MDRVFPKNLDKLDKSDLSKAVDQLDTYIRYMMEQIEWAVHVLMKLDNGTSVADIANRVARLERSVGQLNQEYTQVSNAVTELSNDKADAADVVMKASVVTTIGSGSTDDEIPTAKAVYDLVNGGN